MLIVLLAIIPVVAGRCQDTLCRVCATNVRVCDLCRRGHATTTFSSSCERTLIGDRKLPSHKTYPSEGQTQRQRSNVELPDGCRLMEQAKVMVMFCNTDGKLLVGTTINDMKHLGETSVGVKIEYIRELDGQQTVVDSGHRVTALDFQLTPFDVMSESLYSIQDIPTKYLPVEVYMPKVSDNFMVSTDFFVFMEDGTTSTADEIVSVKSGDVRMSALLSGWNWTTSGELLELTYKVIHPKAEKMLVKTFYELPKVTSGIDDAEKFPRKFLLEFDTVQWVLTISRKVNVDGKYYEMSPDYPKLVRYSFSDNPTLYIKVALPRFHTYAMFDLTLTPPSVSLITKRPKSPLEGVSPVIHYDDFPPEPSSKKATSQRSTTDTSILATDRHKTTPDANDVHVERPTIRSTKTATYQSTSSEVPNVGATNETTLKEDDASSRRPTKESTTHNSPSETMTDMFSSGSEQPSNSITSDGSTVLNNDDSRAAETEKAEAKDEGCDYAYNGVPQAHVKYVTISTLLWLEILLH